MKKFLVSVLAIAGLVACHNEEAVRLPEHNQAIAFADAFVENATRVAEDPGFNRDNLAAFDVWAWMDEKDGTVLTDENVTKNNGEWTYQNVQYWTPDHDFHFVAVAPMDSANWDYNYTEDTIAFTNVDGTEDLLFVFKHENTDGKNINSTYEAVALKFAHLLAKTKFTFTNGFATNNMFVEVSDIKMTAPESATFDFNFNTNNREYTEGWGTVSGTTELAYGDVVKTDFGKKNESTYERFTIPASAAQEYVVTYTITVYRGTVKDYTVTKTSTITGVELEKGKSYNFVAEINPETLNMQEIKFNVVVDEWIVNGQDNGSIAEAELRAAVQLGGVVAVAENVDLGGEPLYITESTTLNLADGVILTGSIDVAEGVSLTVNGGAIVNNDNTTSGIVSNGTLELNDVNVTSARHALRIESGDVVINGGEYRVAPISNSTLYALNVGDDNTVANVTINGGTFVGPKGTQADSGGAVTVKAGSTVVINGGDFSGGKTKTLSAKGSLTVYGGTFDQDPAAFVAEGYYTSKLDNKFYVADAYLVADAAGLQAALDANKADIRFVADIEGDVTNTQKPGVVIAVDGDGYNYAGVIVVDGKSGTYTTAGLTIKNVNFVADAISADACVRLGDGNNATRYTCNVTLDNCTFDVPGAVGVKSYTGGDKNLVISECTATANAHSLVQAKGIDGILVKDCTVLSKNGMNFNNSTNVVVDNCTTDVKGYAVRFGESSGGTGAAEVYTIKNSTLKSACEDGDSVIILRGTADYSTLTIENTTIDGERSIANTAIDAKVIVDGKEVTAIASSSAELKNAIVNGATIALTEGTYSLPSLSGKEGVVIIGTEGTVIGGDNASTGFGSNFGKNTTIKNVTFSGTTNGVRWSYAQGGEAVFENCTFAGGSTYGFHIDESHGATFTFNDCVFSGFNAFAGDLVSITFNNCVFEHNGNYGHTNIWSVAYFNDCTWDAGTSVSGNKLYFNGVEESWKHNF